jgi:Flp pilus assembly protein TadD
MPHEALAALGAPRSADAWSWAGILRDEIADLPGAEQAHRQAVALDPGSDRLRNNLGFNLLLQGRREEAAEEFRRALELNPTSEFARNNLLTATATLQATGNDATAHSNYAAVLIEQGRYEEARKEVAIALSYDIGHPAALSNLRLLSALDGGALVLPGSRTGTLWDRMSRTLLKALLGIEDKPAGAAEKGSE